MLALGFVSVEGEWVKIGEGSMINCSMNVGKLQSLGEEIGTLERF